LTLYFVKPNGNNIEVLRWARRDMQMMGCSPRRRSPTLWQQFRRCAGAARGWAPPSWGRGLSIGG